MEGEERGDGAGECDGRLRREPPRTLLEDLAPLLVVLGGGGGAGGGGGRTFGGGVGGRIEVVSLVDRPKADFALAFVRLPLSFFCSLAAPALRCPVGWR